MQHPATMQAKRDNNRKRRADGTAEAKKPKRQKEAEGNEVRELA